MPMWRNPIPWKVTPETPNLGKMAETDDMRPASATKASRTFSVL
jgi:hypothetical protein